MRGAHPGPLLPLPLARGTSYSFLYWHWRFLRLSLVTVGEFLEVQRWTKHRIALCIRAHFQQWQEEGKVWKSV